MSWNENADVSPTLRAGMGSHPPEVFVYDGKENGGEISCQPLQATTKAE